MSESDFEALMWDLGLAFQGEVAGSPADGGWRSLELAQEAGFSPATGASVGEVFSALRAWLDGHCADRGIPTLRAIRADPVAVLSAQRGR